MTEEQRWRLWTGSVAGSMIVGVIATVTAIAVRSPGLMFLSLAFIGFSGIAIIGVAARARSRPALLVPPHLRGLDPDRQRLVVATVDGGLRAAAPELAPAVIASAHRRIVSLSLLLASGTLAVSVRISNLASGRWGAGDVIDLLVVIAWLVIAGFMAGALVRARRAVVANRSSDER